jgi:hypothetical protein
MAIVRLLKRNIIKVLVLFSVGVLVFEILIKIIKSNSQDEFFHNSQNLEGIMVCRM